MNTLSKNDSVTAEQVLDIIRNTRGFHVHIDYCSPEQVSEQDKNEIFMSADYFRDTLTLAQVEQEMEECRWLWADGEPSPVDVASFILNISADHGIYNTISISLIPNQ